MNSHEVSREPCCYGYATSNGAFHEVDCPVEVLLRGNPIPRQFRKPESLENSSTVCHTCCNVIVAPVADVFCSEDCFNQGMRTD